METLTDRNRGKRMVFVICLGLPGSGKSTFATKLQQQLDELKINCGTFSRDTLRIQEDGSYVFNPETEPLVQNTHLDLLYQLAEERNYNVVIVDDANLKYTQLFSTLLAIDHPENVVILCDFEPISPYRHLDRTKRNGHRMSMERLVHMAKCYHETVQKSKDLDLIHQRFTFPDEKSPDFDKNQEEAIGTFTNSVVETILDDKAKKFHLLDYCLYYNPDIKRHLFDQYKIGIVPLVCAEYPSAAKKPKIDEEQLIEDEDEDEDEDDPIEDD